MAWAEPGAPAPNPFFTAHARAYATSARHAAGRDLARLVAQVGAGPGLTAVDVATGTGHTALALAAAGCRVIGIDPTPAMLAEAAALARERGLQDRVEFRPGWAEALPLPDRSARIVTCRRAAHHFTDVPRAVREMCRVLAPGGRLGISDMAPEPGLGDELDALERLRDPTHACAWDEDRWRAAVEGAGLRCLAVEVSVEELSLEEWLAPASPDGAEARAVRARVGALAPPLLAALCGGDPTRWRKRRMVLAAERPA